MTVSTNVTTPAMRLPANFVTTERGNTWLHTTDQAHHVVIANVSGKRWLLLSMSPNLSTHPAFTLATKICTKQEMADHISNTYAGWISRKCGVKDVPIFDGLVLSPDGSVPADDEPDIYPFDHTPYDEMDDDEIVAMLEARGIAV